MSASGAPRFTGLTSCLGTSSHSSGQCRTVFPSPLKGFMSQIYIPFLDDPIPGCQPGGLGGHEKWWVERQETLEQAGYMLRPRF